MNENSITVEQIAAENQRYMVKVYSWMSLAMIITGAVAIYTASNETLRNLIHSNNWIFFGLIIFEFIAVGVLVKLVNKMSVPLATLIFILYSVLNGLTLSFIFYVYTEASIASTFFVTAGTFGVMSIYGYTTKTDLSKWGNLLFMGLIGLVIASLVNYFMQSSMLYWITTGVGVIIFVGLTAHDTQKIKNANIIGNEGSDDDHKESIIGALILYLDFINLFLFLLRIFGRRR
ncbi:MAG TPA: Bax inhibitor-1/YccA family protein [Ohtaekwangia sp.]|nr:Bax inhibitor-1/YccA family protein [Ohtaekwangia sp.]